MMGEGGGRLTTRLSCAGLPSAFFCFGKSTIRALKCESLHQLIRAVYNNPIEGAYLIPSQVKAV